MSTPAHIPSNPAQFEQDCTLLASVLSAGRRRGVRIMSGPERGFSVSGNTARVYVPFPPLLADWTQRTLTCGIALQCSPSKERVARLPIAELSRRQQQALSRVEGGVAMAWVLARCPGLGQELQQRLPDLKAQDPDLDADTMLQLALNMASEWTYEPSVNITNGVQQREQHALLGRLPLATAAQPGFVNALRRLYGRMPWSTRGRFAPGQFSIPAGGDGNVQNPNLPPPSRPQDDTPPVNIGERAGIPYPEWNVWTRQFLPHYVAVLERPVTAAVTLAAPVSASLQRWFEAPTHRTLRNRLEDGCDLDVDQYLNHVLDQAGGGASDGRIFRDLVPAQRDVATALLLDGSASLGVQQGRVFTLELACADALSRAMVRARERHGLFVFSGHTRHRVDVVCLKDFDERRAVLPGQLGLSAGGYTRLGAPIRHLTQRLLGQRSGRRLLIMMGDGQMSDEGYEGYYAWADVAHAVEEAEDAGVFPYYIGVGPARVDPLPDVFGVRRSIRINTLDELPRVLARVHQQLVAA
ncbi:nitric oxide reductase activation protein NorD [Ketobacter sp.]|uniref:nitric oxide reductase activation protein NorD n=1 Tax=Ketobacter sp. TaxID=2083498 RepID=UPI000F1132B7|nr:VWA domain-containing protein [Ketobacter sp.]RLT92800.1 MAG: VWA domain-containing protein [Ketobacter sp.]